MDKQKRNCEIARLWAFIGDACELEGLARSAPADLHRGYVAWANARSVDPMSKIQMGVLLTGMGFQRAIAPGGRNVRLGLRIREAVA